MSRGPHDGPPKVIRFPPPNDQAGPITEDDLEELRCLRQACAVVLRKYQSAKARLLGKLRGQAREG